MHEATKIVYDCFDDTTMKRYSKAESGSIYTAIGNAVKRKLPDYKSELSNPKIVKILGEIISNGVLQEIIDEQERLIEAQKQKLSEITSRQVNAINSAKGHEKLSREYEEKYVGLKWECTQLERRLEVLKDNAEAESVKDIRLCGAMQAYDFILSKTKDEKLACKAFNSYLLGYGENANDYEPEEKPKKKVSRL